MRLTHLGQHYTASTLAIETVETETNLQFMGRTFKRRVAKSKPTQPRRRQMAYRGVSYIG